MKTGQAQDRTGTVVGAFVMGIAVGTLAAMLLVIPMVSRTTEGWKAMAEERAEWALRAESEGWEAGYAYGREEGERRATAAADR